MRPLSLFNRSIAARGFFVAVEPDGPVGKHNYDEQPDHHVRTVAEHPHAFEDPLEKVSGGVKDVCPGDREQLHRCLIVKFTATKVSIIINPQNRVCGAAK